MASRRRFGRARHGLWLLRALLVEAVLCLAQPGTATRRGSQLLGQLVAALVAIERVLGLVDAARLLEDLLGDLLVVAGRVRKWW